MSVHRFPGSTKAKTANGEITDHEVRSGENERQRAGGGGNGTGVKGAGAGTNPNPPTSRSIQLARRRGGGMCVHGMYVW